MSQGPATVIHAGAIGDAQGIEARPGSVAARDGVIAYAGPHEGLPAELLKDAEVIDKPDCLLLPAMVNAHTHLELTDIGPQPYDPAGGFVGWVKMLRGNGEVGKEARLSILRQAAMDCVQAGVQATGDIGWPVKAAAVRWSVGMLGQTYQELFGLGPPFDEQARLAIEQPPYPYALQPHAPYSTGPDIYMMAARSGRPVSTHLAEHPEEADFVGKLGGAMFKYLRSIKRWSPAFAAHYGQGLSPVQWMRPYLETAAPAGGWLVAHCNYVNDEDINILADTNTSVAYCPIASEYFGHQGHRYRDMLTAEVNVCLGTDSIVCANPDDPQPLGLLSAMRRLYQRDKTDPAALLRMATTNGAKALRQPAETATFMPGAPARFALVPFEPADPTDPLTQVLNRNEPINPMYF